MEINELISGKWYRPTKGNTNYYYKYIRMEDEGIIANYFTVTINKIIKKEALITNSDFWTYAKEVEYCVIQQFMPEEFKEKHCEYLIHN